MFLIAVSSCTKTDDVLTRTREQEQPASHADEPNRFLTPKDLSSTIRSLSAGASLRSLSMSEIEDKGVNTHLVDEVPNEGFRRLLSSKGEFIVGDSIYRIVPQGTLFAHIARRELLDTIVSNNLYPSMTKTGKDSLLTLGNQAYLFLTFGEEALGKVNIQEVEDEEPESTSFRSLDLARDHVELIPTFEVKAMDRITVAGKAIQGIVGGKKDGKTVLNYNRKRRLSGSLYHYNYFVYSETGMEAKVEKKMWHGGWGKMKNWDEGTIIGYAGIILQEEVPLLANTPYFHYTDVWDNGSLPTVGQGEGLYVGIDRNDFLLSKEDKFAFYPFTSGRDLSYYELEEIADKLRAGNTYTQSGHLLSFDKLKQDYGTNCVGFTVDIPGLNKRYTYLKGSWSWKGGPQQVKIFDSQYFSIDFKKAFDGASRAISGISKILGKKKDQRDPGSPIVGVTNDRYNVSHLNIPHLNPQALPDYSSEHQKEKALNDIKEGIKTFLGSFEAAKSRVRVAGSAYCCVSDGGGITGMIMQKVRF